MSPLVVERVEVSGAREAGTAEVGAPNLEAVVRVGAPEFMRTSAFPGLAERVVALMPGIVRHRCDCGSAHGIVQELADTETPHLAEHVALELMALSGSSRDLRGETTWDFAADGRGVFRVRVGFDDERVARAALAHAALVVNALLEDEQVPVADEIAEELRALRPTRAARAPR